MKNLALFSLYIDRFFKTAIPEGVYSYHRLLLSAPFYLSKQRERHIIAPLPHTEKEKTGQLYMAV